MVITFTGKRAYDFAYSGVAFQVIVDGVETRCLVSEEALTDHFGAPGIDPQSLMVAFDGGREVIESLAEDRIRLGVAPPFVLATADF